MNRLTDRYHAITIAPDLSIIGVWAAWIFIVQLTIQAPFADMAFVCLAPLVFSRLLNRYLCALLIVGHLCIALIFILTHHPVKADVAITLAYYFFLIGILKVIFDPKH